MNAAKDTGSGSEAEQKPPRPARALAEAVVITAALPGIGWLWHRDDPFFLRHGFAWLILAPLLVGLRHGSTAGLVSAALLDAAMAVAWRLSTAAVPILPWDAMLGLFVLAMLCGQFSDVFQRQLRKVRGGLGETRRRLEKLGEAYVLLELSHDRLVQRTGRAAPNLTDAIAGLRKQMDAGDPFRSVARPLLDLLSNYFMVEVASIHEVEGRGIVAEPLGALGSPRPIPPDDPLVLLALGEGAMAHVPLARDRGAAEERSTLLAAVPFFDASGVRALVCIEAMPFVAFERRSLEALASLGAHLANGGGAALAVTLPQRGSR